MGFAETLHIDAQRIKDNKWATDGLDKVVDFLLSPEYINDTEYHACLNIIPYSEKVFLLKEHDITSTLYRVSFARKAFNFRHRVKTKMKLEKQKREVSIDPTPPT